MKFNTVKIESGASGFSDEKDFVRLEIEGRFNHREAAALVKMAPELLEALKELAASIKLKGLNVRKTEDYHLMVAHAAALKAIHKQGAI